MTGLTDLEVYNSIFNITEENNKIKLSKLPDEKSGGITYEKVRDEIGRDLDISDITAADLQDDRIGPIIIKEYKEQVTERMKNDQYMRILSNYTSSVFQDCEIFHRTKIYLIEDEVRLVLDEYDSSFITYEISPKIYTFKDISEALLKVLQPKHDGYHDVIDTAKNGINMKTKLIVGTGIIAIRIDEKSFFTTILGFTPSWDYKPYNVHMSQKIVNLSTTNKM